MDGATIERGPIEGSTGRHGLERSLLFAALTGDSAGFEAVSLRIGTIWGPLGLPDNPFTPLPRLLSAAVRGEDSDLTPPRPPAYAEDATDLCYVTDCGRAIALLMLADRLDHRIYNVSSGRLVRNSEAVDAINAAVPGADITLPEGCDPDRPTANYLDTTRLRADTGFRPEYDVERAVPDYVDRLRVHDRQRHPGGPGMTVFNDEARALFAGPNIAHIATLLPDGGPHPVPVMIDIDGEYLALFTSPDSCKGRNLVADDRIFAEYTGGPYPRGEYREAFLVEPAHVIVPTFG